ASWESSVRGCHMFQLTQKLRGLKSELRRLHGRFFAGMEARVIVAREFLQKKQCELRDLYTLERKGALDRADLELRARHRRRCFTSLVLEDGTVVTSPQAMREELVRYFGGLLGSAGSVHEPLKQVVVMAGPVLSVEQQ
ncbi:hypothetical protein Dimus_017808, partial [Dionaea muscipula]